MKHKHLYAFAFIAVVCLLFSCTLKTEQTFDYRAVRPEYREQAERFWMGRMLQETIDEDTFAVNMETCSHEFGNAYRKDAETHCPVCRRCQKIMGVEEPHSGVTMHLIKTMDGIAVYGLQCAVCSKERISAADPPFFAYRLTKGTAGGEES